MRPVLLSFLTEATGCVAQPDTARGDYTQHARSQKTSQIEATEVRKALFDTPVKPLVSDNNLQRTRLDQRLLAALRMTTTALLSSHLVVLKSRRRNERRGSGRR